MARLTSLREAAAKGYSELKKFLGVGFVMGTVSGADIITTYYLEVCEKNGRVLIRDTAYTIVCNENGRMFGNTDYTHDRNLMYKEFAKLKRFHPDCDVRIMRTTTEITYTFDVVD